MPGALHKPLPDRCDVVVAGAGIGGLVCAVELARQGLSVAVFDRAPVPGGAARTLAAGGFHFDVSMHHVGGFAPGCAVHGILSSLGVLDRLQVLRRSAVGKVVFPDWECAITGDLDALRDSLITRFPEEREGIASLLSFLPRLKADIVGPTLVPDYNVPYHDRPSSGVWNKTYGQLLHEFVSDPQLRSVLSQMWMYVGAPPSRSTAAYAACVHAAAFGEGAWSVVGGGAALVRHLIERLRECGGDVWVDTPVSKVHIADGAVRAVTCGAHTVACRVAVLAGDPRVAVDDLLDAEHVSQAFGASLAQAEAGMSMFATYVGLRCPAAEAGFADDAVFVNHGVDADEAYRRVLQADVARTDYCVVAGAHQAASVAPHGQGTVAFVEPTPTQEWIWLDGEAAAAREQEVAQRLWRKYTQAFPGLERHALQRVFVSPRTWRDMLGTRDGAVFGFLPTARNAAVARNRLRTPLTGLYLAGAFGSVGAGYEGVMIGGVQAANAVLSDFAFPYRSHPVSLRTESGVPQGPGVLEDAPSVLSELVRYDASVSLDGHYRHVFETKVYGDELNSRGCADASSYLRYLDRARTELIEDLGLGDPAWQASHQMKVYRIVMRCATVTRLSDVLEVRTGTRRVSRHRVAFDQRIRNRKTDRIVADASVELLIVNERDQLQPIPPQLFAVDGAVPDFLSDRTDPLPFRAEEAFPFRSRFRVYFEDTDLQRVMFHVSHVRFCERALFDIVETVWPDVSTNVWMNRTNAVVGRIDIRYLKAARLGDPIEVRSALVGVDEHKLSFGQRLRNARTAEVVADAVLDVEFRDNRGARFPVPTQILDLARAYVLHNGRSSS